MTKKDLDKLENRYNIYVLSIQLYSSIDNTFIFSGYEDGAHYGDYSDYSDYSDD